MKLVLLRNDDSVVEVEEIWDKSRPFRECRENSEHLRVYLGEDGPLRVILPKPTITDFLWTGTSDCLITDEVAKLLRETSLTGYYLRPAKVAKIKRMKGKLVDLPILWEFRVIGWGGIASPASGIRQIEPRCLDCGYSYWGTLTDKTRLFDEASWDGSDFFIIWPLPLFYFLSEKAMEFIRSHNFTNVSLTPFEKIPLLSETVGYLDDMCPGRLSHYMPADRAKEIGGPLGID